MDGGTPAQETDFRALLDAIDEVAVWVVEEPGEFAYVSAGIEDIWGVPAQEIEGDPDKMVGGIHPADRERVVEEMSKPPEAVTETTYEGRVVKPDGTVRWTFTRQIPVRDGEGELLRIVGITTDITDQKRREEELDALNRVVRHDIRNDMEVVLGWGEVLEAHVDAEGAEFLERILAAGDHIVELTEVARDYAETVAGGGEMALEPVSLRETLEREVTLRREYFPGARFDLGEVPDVAVRANEMLASVFRNLLNNAVQHNDADEPVVAVTAAADGDSAVVRVADNGPGLPDGVRDSVFEAGERGLDSSGTGIGLHLVQTLVEQYGGEVWVTDNEPRGTVFHVELPLAE